MKNLLRSARNRLKPPSNLTVNTLLLVGAGIGLLAPRKRGSALFFFFPFYQVGGAERVHADIVACVADCKPWVFFTNQSKDRKFKSLFERNARLFDLSSFTSHRFAHYLCLGALSAFINKHDAPVVFGSNSVFFYQLLPRLRREVRRIDLVHAFGGGIEHVSLPFVDTIGTRVVINSQTQLDLQSQYTSNGIERQLLERIMTIENQVRVPEQFPEKREGTDLNVLYVGRESEEKRIHLAIEAAKLCHQSNVPATFTFVGDIKPSAQTQPPGHLHFKGEIANPRQLNELYQEAHVLVLTSRSEGFPLVIMEAMAHGAVPVSTDVGGISSHVSHGTNGLLIQAESEEEIVASLVAALTLLAEDRQMLNQLSINAYRYAREHFAPQKFCQAYRRLLLGAGDSEVT
jgi:glycosyltransferase involved in cell wall biosynthesis